MKKENEAPGLVIMPGASFSVLFVACDVMPPALDGRQD